MHPGEQHIRGEMVKAVMDHFNAATILVDGVPFTFDWTEGSVNGLGLTVHNAAGEEVARYRVKVSAEKVGSPRPIATTPAPALEPELEPTPEPVTSIQLEEPSPIKGMWGNVTTGCTVVDDSGKHWSVKRDGDEVTISCGDESYTFSPTVTDPVKYLPPIRSESV